MDTVDKKTRSRIMASVKQYDTGPEMRLRHILHRLGMRYRLHDKRLPGSPDLVFPRFRAVVFVHGCFWHVHNDCRFSTKPSSRKKLWEEKFKANKKRDNKNYHALEMSGWRVLVVWECAIKVRKDDQLIKLGFNVVHWLKSHNQYGEIGEKHAVSTVSRRKKT
jgi:DNA mismatch endonuclease (patch repair protein)